VEFGREGETRQSVDLGNPGHLVKSTKMGELGQHKNEDNWKSQGTLTITRVRGIRGM